MGKNQKTIITIFHLKLDITTCTAKMNYTTTPMCVYGMFIFSSPAKDASREHVTKVIQDLFNCNFSNMTYVLHRKTPNNSGNGFRTPLLCFFISSTYHLVSQDMIKVHVYAPLQSVCLSAHQQGSNMICPKSLRQSKTYSR